MKRKYKTEYAELEAQYEIGVCLRNLSKKSIKKVPREWRLEALKMAVRSYPHWLVAQIAVQEFSEVGVADRYGLAEIVVVLGSNRDIWAMSKKLTKMRLDYGAEYRSIVELLSEHGCEKILEQFPQFSHLRRAAPVSN